MVVGVNAYQTEGEDYDIETFRVGEASEQEQLRRLTAFRAARQESTVQRQLDALREAAEQNANTMPAIMGAIESGATQGEIINALIDVCGVYRPPAIF